MEYCRKCLNALCVNFNVRLSSNATFALYTSKTNAELYLINMTQNAIINYDAYILPEINGEPCTLFVWLRRESNPILSSNIFVQIVYT